MEVGIPELQYILYTSPDFAVIHIITDFLLAILPIPLVWNIQKDILTRLSLVVVLSLGILAAIAGIIRQLNVAPLDEHDTYSIWNFNELHIGIIAASLPTFRLLFERIFRKVRTAVTHSGSTNRDVSMHGLRLSTVSRPAKFRSISDVDLLSTRQGIEVCNTVDVKFESSPPSDPSSDTYNSTVSARTPSL
jgi:hypothetical protein